jgi:hypothetical protein
LSLVPAAIVARLAALFRVGEGSKEKGMRPHDTIERILRELAAESRKVQNLTAVLGMALVGLRTAVNVHDADDQVLCNVEAGLREMGMDPDKMAADAVRPE